MDKGQETNRWAWLPAAMPGVAKLVGEKRAKYGAAWVAKCWERSMVAGEPGWLFAREGPVAIGTPWDDPELANFAARHVMRTEALLLMREPEAGHGANS